MALKAHLRLTFRALEQGSNLIDESLARTLCSLFIKKWPENSAQLHDVHDVAKAFVIIARNPENVLFLNITGVPALLLQKLKIVFSWVSIDPEIASSVDVADVIRDLLYFFECYYDPRFTWRRKTNRMRTTSVNSYFLQTSPVDSEFLTFICHAATLLSAQAIENGIVESIVNLLGACASGSRNNALNVFCPACVDALTQIFHLLITESCLPVSLARQRLFDVCLKCFAFLIEVLRSAPPDLRQIDLHSTLAKFFGLLNLQNRKPVCIDFIARILCNSSTSSLNQSGPLLDQKSAVCPDVYFRSSFKKARHREGGVNNIIDVSDKAALQIECVAAGAFDCVLQWAKTLAVTCSETRWTQAEVEKLMVSLLQCTCDLVKNCDVTESLFVAKSGYLSLKDMVAKQNNISHDSAKAVFKMMLNASSDELLIPRMTAVLITWAGYWSDNCEQRWILISLSDMANVSILNLHRMYEAGCIEAILETLETRIDVLDVPVINDLFSLLTLLTSHSVSPFQLRKAFMLCCLETTEAKRRVILRNLLRTLSVSAELCSLMHPQRWFSFVKTTDAFLLPGIRHWPGTGFSIHVVLKLDKLSDSQYIDADGFKHRKLYCFLANNYTGFDAFLTSDLSVVVAIATKKDYQTVCIEGTPFSDGCWHTVTISVARRAFGGGQVTVYIDGHMKISVAMRLPALTEPFPYCRIGCGDSQQLDSDAGQRFSQSFPTSLPKGISSFNSTRFVESYRKYSNGVCTIPAGLQRECWGAPMLLHGQISAVCIFTDALQPNHVKLLNEAGLILSTFPDDLELKAKLLAHYSARAVTLNTCFDLSPARAMDAYVSALVCRVDSLKASLISMGGVPTLFGLLQILCAPSASLDDLHMSTGQENVPLDNFVAAFIGFIHAIVRDCARLRDQLLLSSGFPILGYLLKKVSPSLVSTEFLVAMQSLTSCIQSCQNRNLLNNFYKFVLLDFAIWTKSDFTARLGHVQYWLTLVKEDKKYFRKNFGVRFILDTLRMYYCSPALEHSLVMLSADDTTLVRNAFLNITKFLVGRDISYRELTSLLGFIFTSRDNSMVEMVLTLLLQLANAPSGKDQFCLLMFEAGMGEFLFTFLLSKQHSFAIKTLAMQLVIALLKTDKVSEKNKGRLRLQGVGFVGLFHLMKGRFLDVQLALPLVDLILTPETTITTSTTTFQDLVAFLFLLQDAVLATRIEVCRKILTSLFLRPDAVTQLNRCLSWQEALLKLLIVSPSSNATQCSAGSNDVLNDSIELASVATASRLDDGAYNNNNNNVRDETEPYDQRHNGAPFPFGDFNEENLIVRSSGVEKDRVSECSASLSASEILEDALNADVISRPHYPSHLTLLDNSVLDPSSLVLTSSGYPFYLSHEWPPCPGQEMGVTVQSESLQRSLRETETAAVDERPIVHRATGSHHSVNVAVTEFVGIEDPFILPGSSFADFSYLGGLAQSPPSHSFVREHASSDASATSSCLFEHSHGSRRDLANAASSSTIRSSAVSTASSANLLDARQISITPRSSRSSPSPPPPRIFDDLPETIEAAAKATFFVEPQPRTPSRSFADDSSATVIAGLEKQEHGDMAVDKNSSNSEEEELLHLVLNVVYNTVWRGVAKEDKDIWKIRGLIFGALNMIACSNRLILSNVRAHRQLLEMFLQGAYMDAKQQGQHQGVIREVAFELMKLVYDFYANASAEEQKDRFSQRMLEAIDNLIRLVNLLNVEDSLTFFVFGTLSTYLLQSENLDLSALAAAKINDLLQMYKFSADVAAYILSQIDAALTNSLNSNTLTEYVFLIPLVKCVLTKYGASLEASAFLPNLYSGDAFQAQTMYENFYRYARSDDWKEFIAKKVCTGACRFSVRFVQKWAAEMNQFWNECYEQIMVASHKRNVIVGESQLAFQTQILDVFRSVIARENYRYSQVLREYKLATKLLASRWNDIRAELESERGVWRKQKTKPRHWQLSTCENFSRMRLKLDVNKAFQDHADASRLRDNISPPDFESSETLLVKIKPPRREDGLAPDMLAEDEWEQDTAKPSQKQASDAAVGQQAGGDAKDDKVILLEPCQLVVATGVIDGQFQLTTKMLCFWENLANASKDVVGEHSFQVPLLQLREVHLRRYNLRRSALEFFLIAQSNFFINFTTQRRNKIYSKLIGLHPPNLVNYDSRSPADMFKASGIMQRWLNREISNFDYLMQLNTIAGRTYNDLSQYPVFPWILRDYESEELDLSNPQAFRDLSRPIGVANPAFISEVKAKYDHFEDPSGTIPKFHYGTHYSNAPGVIHYLIRLEPFTNMHIQLQSGRFDVADRLFHSIPRTWATLLDSPNDVKELIPEFFYMSEFLVNANRFDLGNLQMTNEKVDHVILPKWASSPEDFIEKHRKALECPYVSEHLSDWIDLIFGYKQKGPDAVEALNVFYYCSYEGAVDLDSIADPAERKAIEGVINNFGQTPCQLLREPHPRRLTFEEVTAKTLRLDSSYLNVFTYLRQCKTFAVQVYNSDADNIQFLSLPRNQANRNIIQQREPDLLFTITGGGLLGAHGWLPFDRRGKNCFTFERDPSLSSAKSSKKLEIGISRFVSSHHFAISLDAKLLFVGGYWDCSFRIFTLSKLGTGSPVIIKRHTDVVTCLALDTCGSHLMTGSADCTCLIWRLAYQAGTSKDIERTTVQILCGHSATVSCVTLRSELDLAVSGSVDGTILVHTVKSGSLYYCLQPPVSPETKSFGVAFLTTSYQGRIVAAICEKGANDSPSYSLHVYSVNGKHLACDALSTEPIGVCVDSDYAVTAHANGVVTVRSLSKLDCLLTVPLRIALSSVTIVPTSSHILCGSRDGKLFVICVDKTSDQFA